MKYPKMQLNKIVKLCPNAAVYVRLADGWLVYNKLDKSE